MILYINPVGTGTYNWSAASDPYGIVFAVGTATSFADFGTQALNAIKNITVKTINIDAVGTAIITPTLWQ